MSTNINDDLLIEECNRALKPIAGEGKLPIENITLSNFNTDIHPESQSRAYRVGNIGMIFFSGALKNVNKWINFELCTMNVKSGAYGFSVLSCQNNKYFPINITVLANDNKLYVHPFGNFVTDEEWFRGQIIFPIVD